MLKFIGIGSCFNTEYGNTSAYILNDKSYSLFLIDCGESVFGELKRRKVLDNLKELTVLITHLHSDHVGSLPSLIFYTNILFGIKVNIIYPDKIDMVEKVLFPVNEELYSIYTPEEYNQTIGKYFITTILQKHCDNIKAYGYEIVIEGKKVYYSGDTNILKANILNKFLNGEYYAFYHEVTKYESKVHYYIERLKAQIPVEKRKNVLCIHLDDKELLDLVKEAGFSIPDFEYKESK